jgi:hypothetical protein
MAERVATPQRQTAAVACLRAAAIAGASPLEPHWVPNIRYQLREAAAELEQRPDHPIAQAIARALAPGGAMPE